MDTSNEYIKMCEKAVEIQLSWKQTVGDFVKHKQTSGWNTEVVDYQDIDNGEVEKTFYFWLPRQDQLQDMVNNQKELIIGIHECCYSRIKFEQLIKLSDGLSKFWREINNSLENSYYSLKPHSMEQLWLAFVMKEKFGKTWNGEDWIKD